MAHSCSCSCHSCSLHFLRSILVRYEQHFRLDLQTWYAVLLRANTSTKRRLNIFLVLQAHCKFQCTFGAGIIITFQQQTPKFRNFEGRGRQKALTLLHQGYRTNHGTHQKKIRSGTNAELNRRPAVYPADVFPLAQSQYYTSILPVILYTCIIGLQTPLLKSFDIDMIDFDASNFRHVKISKAKRAPSQIESTASLTN